MKSSLSFMIIMSICGVISTAIGAFLGGIFSVKTKKALAILFEITAGIMTGLVCFDMLPESFEIVNIWCSILGVIIGVIFVYNIDKYVERNKNISNNSYSTMSLVIVLSMSIDNIVEGIAIGSSLAYSYALGMSVIIAIMLHNIPEGMVVGITTKLDNKNVKSIWYNSMLVGIFLGIGAFLGNFVGNMSDIAVCISMSIAAGAMLYIVVCDLLPNSNKLYSSKKVYLVYVIGLIIGAIITKM